MADNEDRTNFFIDRELRKIEISLGPARYVYPLNAIPSGLLQQQLNIHDLLKEPSTALINFYTSSVFNAVVCTTDLMRPFPTNCAHKLIFMTLKDEILDDTIEEIEGTLLSFQGRPFEETLEARFEFLRDLYLDESKLDHLRLGAIEIFGGKTYRNLLRDPRASLMVQWTDDQSVPRCIQMNCITEIEPRESIFYRYMRTLRTLFSRRYLDLLGRKYACAYKFWISETMSKDLTDPQGFSRPT